MEMLIVIAIIAILIAVATPVLLSQVKKAKAVACAANRHNALGVIAVAALDDAKFGAILKNVSEAKWEDVQSKLPAGSSFDTEICPDGGTITLIVDSKSGAMTLTCSEHKEDVNNYLTNMDKALEYAKKLSVDGKTSDKAYIQAYLDYLSANGLSAPTIEPEELLTLFPEDKTGFYQIKEDNPILWTPMRLSVAGGKKEEVLVAAGQERMNNTQLQGFVVYCGGKYYRSTKSPAGNRPQYVDYVNLYSSNTSKYESMEAYLKASSDWELVE